MSIPPLPHHKDEVFYCSPTKILPLAINISAHVLTQFDLGKIVLQLRTSPDESNMLQALFRAYPEPVSEDEMQIALQKKPPLFYIIASSLTRRVENFRFKVDSSGGIFTIKAK